MRGRHGLDADVSRARLLRMWGGVMDMSMDGSPFIDATGVPGSTLTVDGAMADLKPRRPVVSALPICWRRGNPTGWPRPIGWIDLSTDR